MPSRGYRASPAVSACQPASSPTSARRPAAAASRPDNGWHFVSEATKAHERHRRSPRLVHIPGDTAHRYSRGDDHISELGEQVVSSPADPLPAVQAPHADQRLGGSPTSSVSL